MTQARSSIVPKGKPGTYHCISRCVRRSFLCGFDAYSGQDYEHRKQWIRDRLQELVSIFAIDVGAYAIMSNHLHLVVRLDPERTHTWSDEEVAIRWAQLYPKTRDAHGRPNLPSGAALQVLANNPSAIRIKRERLGCLSWFMRSLNEYIARRANREDGCPGRFWDGRFKSIALLDEAAVLTCSTYVDLNPIRAGLAETLEDSDFTSVQERIFDHLDQRVEDSVQTQKPMPKSTAAQTSTPARRESWLCPLAQDDDEALTLHSPPTHRQDPFLPVDLPTYLQLVEWTGRQLVAGKRGFIPSEIQPILQRHQLREERWLDTIQGYDQPFYRVIGQLKAVAIKARQAGQHWFKGLDFCKQAFLS